MPWMGLPPTSWDCPQLIQPSLENLQGYGIRNFYGQPVAVPHSLLSKEFLPWIFKFGGDHDLKHKKILM